MKKQIYLTILFDCYEKLLNEKDKECFKYYYFDNLSLGEIADNLDISRNAVHKRLKKIEDELNFYEDSVGLYRKEQAVLDLINNEELKDKIRKIFS